MFPESLRFVTVRVIKEVPIAYGKAGASTSWRDARELMNDRELQMQWIAEITAAPTSFTSHHTFDHSNKYVLHYMKCATKSIF